MIYLMEVIKNGKNSFYINNKRAKEHDFCIVLLKHRKGYGVKPDDTKMVSNKGIKSVRNYWFITEERAQP